MSKSEEHKLQNDIRNALAGECKLFRANVGSGWAANKVESYSSPTHVVMYRGDKLLRKARPFDTGLPPGFTDLFGWRVVTITPEMVGKKIAQVIGPEVKTSAGVASPAQVNFIRVMNDDGGVAGVVRSVEDALELVCNIKL